MQQKQMGRLLVCLNMVFIACAVQAQTIDKTADSTGARQAYRSIQVRDTLAAGSDEIIVLDAIEIRGRVQKPGVLLVPKRVEPEMGKMELSRSFDEEVKKDMGNIPKVDKELKRVDRVTSVKKAVDKKRK